MGDAWGRKPVCGLSMVLGGACLLPAAYTAGPARMVLSLAGKFFVTAAFAMIYIHSRALSNGYQVQCFWNLFRHGQNWQHRGTSGCLLLACNRLQGVATDNHGNLSPTWRT